MTERRTYQVNGEPAGKVMHQLGRSAVDQAATLGLIVHSKNVRLTDRAVGVLRAFEPFQISTVDVYEWPGTRLLGTRPAILRTYSVTRESMILLADGADRLFEWVNPSLPEDIHLLRMDGSIFLGSITQEADAWMELSDNEFQSLILQAPDLGKMLTCQP